MLILDNEGNITLTRGDNATLTLTVKNGSEDYDYSDDLVQLTVKRNCVTEDVLIQKTFTGGAIEFLPADTKDLNYQDLYYDVQLITPANKVYTVSTPKRFIIADEVNFNVSRT